jgi:hypothetical protein
VTTKGDVNYTGGCLIRILCLIVIWAVCFGVTVDGHHYGIDLGCKNGVEVRK